MSHTQITNRWGEVEPISVPLERRVVFEAVPGMAYNHHPHIASEGGRLYATWSNGDLNEDDVGQRMLLAVSDDGGATWSEPTAVVPTLEGAHADAVITNGGIRVHDDMLIAYYGHFEFTPAGLLDGHRQPGGMGSERAERWHCNTWCGARTSLDRGRTWEDRGMVVDGFVPNWLPTGTSSGRLIMCGGLVFPYSDDPQGLTGWNVAGLPGLPGDYVDDSEGTAWGRRHRGDTHGYTEGSFFETDDGVLHMFLRTNQFLLAVTESSDQGETWSEPRLTAYTNGNSKHQFGRLPDGRFFGLSTPKPQRGRTPLILATSADGVAFDRHYVLGDEPERPLRFEGGHKNGQYGYPHMHVEGDVAYVIYSVRKEDIVVGRFELADLK